MRQDEATLLDIAEAARLIQVFIGDMAKEAFPDDPKTQVRLSRYTPRIRK